jgi:hypothetical protein
MHCIKLTSPKVLILDQERLSLVDHELPSIHASTIVVRLSDKHYRNLRKVKEWNQVLASYEGKINAWKKEPPCLPDDDATVRLSLNRSVNFLAESNCILDFFHVRYNRLAKGCPLYSKRVPRKRIQYFLRFTTETEMTVSSQANLLCRYYTRDLFEVPPPFGNAPAPPTEPPPPGVVLVAVPLFHVTGLTSQTACHINYGAPWAPASVTEIRHFINRFLYFNL